MFRSKLHCRRREKERPVRFFYVREKGERKVAEAIACLTVKKVADIGAPQNLEEKLIKT